MRAQLPRKTRFLAKASNLVRGKFGEIVRFGRSKFLHRPWHHFLLIEILFCFRFRHRSVSQKEKQKEKYSLMKKFQISFLHYRLKVSIALLENNEQKPKCFFFQIPICTFFCPSKGTVVVKRWEISLRLASPPPSLPFSFLL